MSLPTETVTFLFTDIEGSTRLWEKHTAAMRTALAAHDAAIRAAVEQNRGMIFKTLGDAFCVAFASPGDAVRAACQAQHALADVRADSEPLRVRMALHAGEAEQRDGDYFGPTLNRTARLLAIGHGAQVLLSEALRTEAAADLPAGAAVRDMGLHRLKDLQEPEHVFQLSAPGLPTEFPPLRSLNLHRHNLPLQTTSFIGRATETAETKTLLARSRLLTLTGSGGTGKSRLSLQVAADLLDDFPEGVWLVELAPLSDAARVPQAVAAVLGVREEPGTPLTQTLAYALQSKQLLLVLDNCEHVLEAAARLAETLLKQCPGVKLLASSREALGTPGEQTYRVPPLGLPPTPRPTRPPDVQDLLGCESVRLFADRASLVKADFRLSSVNAPALARLCRRLDGIPLALELAAARVRAMPVEQIETRLHDRFRLLTGGSRTALPRQQTLRALIDWSYDLLTESERRTLRHLSVFAGGWTLEAAEAVCTDADCQAEDVLNLLTSLVDKSLVIYEEQAGEARYRLLETVRQYAQDRLREQGDEAICRDRHRDWFLGVAERAETHLQGPEQAAWVDRLNLEHDNMRAALTWALTEPRGAEAGLRIAGALWRFWQMRGEMTEGRASLADALSRTQGNTPERAKALAGAGNLAWHQGDYAAARALHRECLTVQQGIGNTRGAAAALSNLGLVAYEQGDNFEARDLFEQSLAVLTELSDKRGMAAVLGNLGMVADRHGDYDEANRLYQESLDIKRALGDRHGAAGSLENLGLLADQRGAYEEARRLLEESLSLRRELGDHGGEAATLTNLGVIAKRTGDYDDARALYQQSQFLFRNLGDRRGLAVSLLNLGAVAQSLGDVESARADYEESLPLFQEIGDQFGVAMALCSLGKVSVQQGDLSQAHARYRESLEIRRDGGDRLGMVECLEAFAGLAAAHGQGEQAARLLGASDSLRRAMNAPPARDEVDEFERLVAAARALLSDHVFTRCRAAGEAMTLADAVALALADPPSGESA